jgi:hypothetical protein
VTAERAAPHAASVEVDVGGLRVRIECAVPGLTTPRLARVFAGHVAAPRPRPHARLRVGPAPGRPARLAPPRLTPSVAAALEPIPARLAASRVLRYQLESGLAAFLGTGAAAARAERLLLGAAAPVAFPWGNGAFVGDLGRPGGTLFLATWRSQRALTPPLLNAHGVLLAAVAAARGGLLAHSAAVVAGGVAFLLVGGSGAGKSTLSRRAGGAALSDDGVLVLPHRGRFVAAATPLRQKAGGRGPATGRRWPLGGVLLLRQARADALRPLPPAAALAELVSRHLHYFALLPPALATQALRNAAALLAATPAFRLEFTRGADVVRLLREAGPGGDTVGRAACGARRSGRYSHARSRRAHA